MSEFEWDKVQHFMRDLKWVWYLSMERGYAVPEVEDLKKAALMLLNSAWEGAHQDQITYSSSSGGLQALCLYESGLARLRLSFELACAEALTTEAEESNEEPKTRRIDLSL